MHARPAARHHCHSQRGASRPGGTRASTSDHRRFGASDLGSRAGPRCRRGHDQQRLACFARDGRTGGGPAGRRRQAICRACGASARSDRRGTAPQSDADRLSQPALGQRDAHRQAPARRAGVRRRAALRVATRALASAAERRMARARRAGAGGRVALRSRHPSHRPGAAVVRPGHSRVRRARPPPTRHAKWTTTCSSR